MGHRVRMGTDRISALGASAKACKRRSRKDEAIAAYRKSVASKPDVFESNLNLGLALADTKQAEAEDFLRAATKLKPSGNAAAGHKRAWMALGHLLETSKPNDAAAAYQQA